MALQPRRLTWEERDVLETQILRLMEKESRKHGMPGTLSVGQAASIALAFAVAQREEALAVWEGDS